MSWSGIHDCCPLHGCAARAKMADRLTRENAALRRAAGDGRAGDQLAENGRELLKMDGEVALITRLLGDAECEAQMQEAENGRLRAVVRSSIADDGHFPWCHQGSSRPPDDRHCSKVCIEARAALSEGEGA